MKSFLTFLAEQKHKVKEDMVMAMGDAPVANTDISNPMVPGTDEVDKVEVDDHALGSTDVLGKCDHQKDGFMGKGCFHLPKRMGRLQRRFQLSGDVKIDDPLK